MPDDRKCPHCGAAVEADPAKKQFVCSSCGKSIQIDKEAVCAGNDGGADVPMVERIKDYGEGEKEERNIVVLRTIATVFANLTAILSINYLVFYILDHFTQNLHFVVRSEFVLVRNLHYLIPILTMTTAFLYLLLLVVNGFSRRKLRPKRFILLLTADILVAGVFATAINAYTFDWFNVRVKNMNVAVDIDATETETPFDEQYEQKFTDGEVIVREPNTVETLEDGTERTLIYTYASGQVAVDMYHYQLDGLEYQIADIYVRDVKYLTANYSDNKGNAHTVPEFAEEIGAVTAINSDNFATNAIGEGLIIRNGTLIRNQPCRYSDLCVIYQNGTVRCFEYNKDYDKDNPLDNEEILSSYPYHSFYFGPSLLDEEGNAKIKFNSTLDASNPRSVFGYYSPGHYAFLCVLGDRAMKDIEGHGLDDGQSPGMTLQELSELCANLGMKAAYNLDGGNASTIYGNETVFGHNNRATSDILAVIDE